MASRVEKFYENAPHLATPQVVDPARVKTGAEEEKSGIGGVADDIGSTIVNTVAPFLQGLTGGLVGAQAGRLGVGNQVSSAVAQQATQTQPFQTLQNMEGTNEGVQTAAVAPIGATLAGLDYGYRGMNTGIGGTVLLTGAGIAEAQKATASVFNREDTITNPNPLFRDGFQLEDLSNTYKEVWDQKITAGQAIATNVGRGGMNMIDFVSNGRAQAAVNEWIMEETERQMMNPLNTGERRADGMSLLGWNVGLHSDFNVFNDRERKSAYNQGVGRWITGASDAAIAWWLGPEVIAAKVAGKGLKTLFQQSYDSLADLRKASDDFAAGLAKDNGDEFATVVDDVTGETRQVKARYTPIYKLAKSLTKMSEEQVLRHKIAKSSTDAALVSRVLGRSTTVEGTVLRMRAMQGDQAAVKQLFDQDIIAADALSLQTQRAKRLDEILGKLDDSNADSSFDEAVANLRLERDRLDEVLAKAKEESEELRSALTGFSRDSMRPNRVRLNTISVSKLDFGANSVQRMERQAKKAADRSAGLNYRVDEFKTGGSFGRVIRVFKAEGARWRSMRQNGLVDLNNPNDLLAEIDAAFQTRFFRKLMSKYGSEARLPRINPETGVVENTGMRVTELREQTVRQLIDAESATERFAVVERFNELMNKALQDAYQLDADRSKDIINKYRTFRNAAYNEVEEKGALQDSDGSIAVLEDLQSMLAERAVVDDLTFLETIYRIERGSRRAKGNKFGTGAYAKFDAIWRPLVLLRLGYTQRNVAEGWLRELAAFGTLGVMKDVRAAVAADGETPLMAWATRLNNTAESTKAVLRRFTVGGQRKIQRQIEQNRNVAKHRLSLAQQAQKEADDFEAQMVKIREKRRKQMEKQAVEDDRELAGIGAAVTWDRVDTAARGRVTEWADTAEEVIIPVQYMEPITAVTTQGVRRARVGYAFDDAAEANQRQLTSGDIPTESVLDPDAALASEIPGNPEFFNSFKPFLPKEQADEMDNILLDLNNPDTTLGDDALARLDEMAGEGFANMAATQMREGRVIFRIVDSDNTGNGIYERVWSPDDITPDDLYTGNLVSTTQEQLAEGAQYVRAQTYGRSVDLRVDADRELDRLAKFDEGPAAADSMTPQQQMDWETNFAGKILDMFADPQQYRQSLDGPVSDNWNASRELDMNIRFAKEAEDEYFQLLENGATGKELEFAKYRMESRWGRVEDELVDVSAMIDFINQDPEFAAAVATQLWVRSAPEETRKILEEAGMLADSDILRKMRKAQTNRQREKDRLRQEYAVERDAMIEDAERVAPLLDEIGSDLRLFHGGSRVPDDTLLPNPKPAGDAGGAYRGVGFYMTRDSGIASEYLVGPKGGENAFFGRAVGREGEEPVLYAIRSDETMAQQFMDLDEAIGDPNLDRYLEDLFEHMRSREAADVDFDNAWLEVEDNVRVKYNNDLTPLTPGKEPRTEPLNVNDYREAFIKFFQDRKIEAGVDPEDADYAAQMLWVNASREVDGGVLGVRHLGGKNLGSRDHDVYIWYGDQYEELMLEPVQSLSTRAVAMQDVYNKIKRLTVRQEEGSIPLRRYGKFARFDPEKFDLATMPGPVVERLGRAMSTNNGIGRVKVNDSNNPYGWTWMVNPESVVSGADNNLDRALPGEFVGDNLVNNKMRIFMDQESALDPAVWSPGAMSNDELLGFFGGNQAAVDFVTGKSDEVLQGLSRQVSDPAVMGNKSGIKAERKLAKTQQDEALVDVINFMDQMGYTHLQVGGTNSQRILSVSEMLGRSRTGAAYRGRLDSDRVDDMTTFSLANDPEYQKMVNDLDQLKQEAFEKTGALEEIDSEAQMLYEMLESVTRVKKREARPTRARGYGEEKFATRAGGRARVLGPMNANNEGSAYAQMVSADRRNQMDLLGYADRDMRALQRTQREMDYKPDSPMYWEALAREINNMYRNDPVAMKILERDIPIGAPLNDVAPILDEILGELTTTDRGRAWLRDIAGVEDFRGMVDSGVLTDDAMNIGRETVYKIYEKLDMLGRKGGINGTTSREFLDTLAAGEVSARWLKSNLGWRSDMPAIRDFMYVDPGMSVWQKGVSTMMRKLGTTPENRLVRHPFYRARWRESMQGQLDLVAEQKRAADPNWDGMFTDAEINSIQSIAKREAVKQTHETLYTINRLSTPAHVFRFVIPFFPAWASTMRFWLMRMPMEKPESIARYAMAFDSPERIGMMYDRQGDQVDPAAQEGNLVPALFESIAGKFGGSDDKQMVIQMSPSIAKKVSPFLGGQDTLKISKGSLDMMLQGDFFFMPGFGPAVTVPVQWLASQAPAVTAKLEAGFFGTRSQAAEGEEVPWDGTALGMGKVLSDTVTQAMVNSVIPFGVTKEKTGSRIVEGQVVPPWIDKVFRAIWQDGAAFSNTTNAMYRNEIIEWELSGRTTPEPNFFDSVNKARNFFLFRAAVNLTAPFAPSFDSKFKFYVDEWRRLERESREFYEANPQQFVAQYGDDSSPYTVALDTFLDSYGEEYYAATKSLSGNSSGMGPNVGEYEIVNDNPRLTAQLAGLGDENDASFVTMLSRPFSETVNTRAGYDQSVYAWQFDRPIKGAPGKFFRESSRFREDMRVDMDVELGWREFERQMAIIEPDLEILEQVPINDLQMRQQQQVAAKYGFSDVDEARRRVGNAATEVRKVVANQIGQNNPRWLEKYNSGWGVNWMKAEKGIELMLSDERLMAQVDKLPEDHPARTYFTAIEFFQQNRAELQNLMVKLNQEQGRSLSVNSRDGEVYMAAYREIVRQAKQLDPSGNFADMFERYFGGDRLIANGQVVVQ